jgi:hypothetical protein
MARRKRTLVGEDTKNMTIKIRSTVYDKLEALAGPSGSKVETIERTIEYLFRKRVKRISNTMKDNALIQ